MFFPPYTDVFDYMYGLSFLLVPREDDLLKTNKPHTQVRKTFCTSGFYDTDFDVFSRIQNYFGQFPFFPCAVGSLLNLLTSTRSTVYENRRVHVSMTTRKSMWATRN